ncbi:hypothetical protein NKJ66_07825 [Mesorhizobium sp. M0078]|uniref:hypothetical protein n=1 Tax=Mesorhizobium sp. M0078 TaxID=2956871 RepID=UPI003334D909
MMPSGSADAALVARCEPVFDLTFVFGAWVSNASSFDGQFNRSNDLTKSALQNCSFEMLAILDQEKNRGRENTVKYIDASLRGEWSRYCACVSSRLPSNSCRTDFAPFSSRILLFPTRISKDA